MTGDDADRGGRAVALLCACQGLLAAGQSLAFPFFAIYLHESRGMAMVAVGAWLSAAVFASALSQGLGGELSDALGRRRVMTLSLWLRAATVLAMAAAIRGGWAFPVLISLHLASSFVANFFDPAARSWIADHMESDERHRAFGWLRTATNAGYAAGPALGGLMAAGSYPLLFALCAAACAVCAVIVGVGLLDHPRAHARPFEASGLLQAAEDKRFLSLCLLNLLISVAMAQLIVPLSMYATSTGGITKAQVGLLFSMNGLLVALFQVPATSFMAGRPLTSALSAGCLAYAAGYAWVGWARGFGALAGAMAVITAAEILVPAATHALAANMAPPKSRGRYLGFFGLSRQLGSALGPMLGCAGLEYLSARWAPAHWLVIAGVGVVSAYSFSRLGGSLTPAEQGGTDLGLSVTRNSNFGWDPGYEEAEEAAPARVCLVDDEKEFTDLASSLLVMNGYEVTAYNDPRDALAALKTASYAALVLDIMMPEMDGFDFLRAVEAQRLAVPPIIALSAKVLTDEERRFLLERKVTFVRKPFQPRRILELIQKAVKTPAAAPAA